MDIIHGGQLTKVAQSFSLDEEGWLDLSTGISPFSYPVPEIPEQIWRELPHENQSLINAAKKYYGANEILVTSGSQSIIQVLPKLWCSLDAEKTTVLLPLVGYKEHEKAWRENGFYIKLYKHLPSVDEIKDNSILVVINPNNPSGELIDISRLMVLHQQLKHSGGWLIIDEAFMDVCPKEYSMIALANQDSLFVLRSMGKFFGLAGIRIGFVSCHSFWLKKIRALLGPWHVNGPALYIAEKAISDTGWQQQQLQLLSIQSSRLKQILLNVFCAKEAFKTSDINGTDLFVTVKHPQAERIYNELCRMKIYLRLCDSKQELRCGIPNEQGLVRLATGLASINCINYLCE